MLGLVRAGVGRNSEGLSFSLKPISHWRDGEEGEGEGGAEIYTGTHWPMESEESKRWARLLGFLGYRGRDFSEEGGALETEEDTLRKIRSLNKNQDEEKS